MSLCDAGAPLDCALGTAYCSSQHDQDLCAQMAHAEHMRRLKSFVTMIVLDYVSNKVPSSYFFTSVSDTIPCSVGARPGQFYNL